MKPEDSSLKRNSSSIKKSETTRGIIKGLIGGIPYLGTIINELLFEAPNRIQQARINNTVEYLSRKLDSIQTNLESKEYFMSEDFYDFTRILFETTVKVKSEEKRKMLANVYLNSIEVESDYETSTNRLFFSFISDLTLNHLVLLKYIQKYGNQLKEIASYSNFYNKFKFQHPNCIRDNYEFKSYCNDLELKGLISMEAGLEDFKSKSAIIVDESHKKSSVSITRFGNKFLSFLTE